MTRPLFIYFSEDPVGVQKETKRKVFPFSDISEICCREMIHDVAKHSVSGINWAITKRLHQSYGSALDLYVTLISLITVICTDT